MPEVLILEATAAAPESQISVNDDLPIASTTNPERILQGDYEVYENVPVFVEHTRALKSGRTLHFGRYELERVAQRSNRRIEETGDFAPVVIGHTSDDPAVPKPPKVGWAGPFRLGWLNEKKDKLAILADFRIDKDKTDILNEYPRRSAELWAEEKYEDMYLDPICLLGAETPWSDLGVLYAKNDGATEKIYYSIQPQAPGAYNVGGFPPTVKGCSSSDCKDKKKEKYMADNDYEALSGANRQIAETIVAAIFDSPEWSYLRRKMAEDGQEGTPRPQDDSPQKVEENPAADTVDYLAGDLVANDAQANAPDATPAGENPAPGDADAATDYKATPDKDETEDEEVPAPQAPPRSGADNPPAAPGRDKDEELPETDELEDEPTDELDDEPTEDDYSDPDNDDYDDDYAAEPKQASLFPSGRGGAASDLDANPDETLDEDELDEGYDDEDDLDEYDEDYDSLTGEEKMTIQQQLDELMRRMKRIERAYDWTTNKVVSNERYSKLAQLRQDFVFDENAEREACRYNKMSDAQFAARCAHIRANYRRNPDTIGLPPRLVQDAPQYNEAAPGVVKYSRDKEGDFERAVAERAEMNAQRGVYQTSEEIRAEIGKQFNN